MDTADQEKSLRLVEAAAVLLEGAPHHALNVTNLNKALFYLDLVALRDRGDTITRTTYLALTQGPVVAKYPTRLVQALENARLARQITSGMAKPI